jgi:hypothetical protein
VATIVEAYPIGKYRPSPHGGSADDAAAIAVAVGVLATAQAPRALDLGIAVDIPFTPGGADDKRSRHAYVVRCTTNRSTLWCSWPQGGARGHSVVASFGQSKVTCLSRSR